MRVTIFLNFGVNKINASITNWGDFIVRTKWGYKKFSLLLRLFGEIVLISVTLHRDEKCFSI